jgi:DNA repair protein SbcC/Rad50
MRIETVGLEDWKSHSNTEIRFRQGANLLVGIMGSGKSSVLDAICYALYGKLPPIRQKGAGAEDMVARGKERACIKLHFSSGEDYFEIRRDLKKLARGGCATDAEIRKNGALVEKGQAATTDYVEALCGTSYDMFTRAVYSEQNGIDYFLSIEPGRRKAEIDRLLGLDRLEDARTNIVKEINARRALAKSLSEKFSPTELEAAAAKEKECVARLAEIEAGLANAAEALSQCRGKHDAARASALRLSAMRKEHEALRNELSVCEGKMQQLSADLDGKSRGAETALNAKRRRDEAEKNAHASKRAVADAQREYAALSAEIGAIEAAIAGMRNAEAELKRCADISIEIFPNGMDNITAETQNAEKELLEAASIARAAEAGMKKLIESGTRINGISGACPVCRRPLDSHGRDAALAELEGEKKALAQKRADAELRASELSKKVETLKKSYRQAVELKSRMAALEKDIVRGKNALAIADAARAKKSALDGKTAGAQKALEAALAQFSEAAAEFAKLEETEAKFAKLESYSKTAAECRARIGKIAYSEAEYEKARLHSEEAKGALERALAQFESLKKEEASHREMLRLAQAQKARLDGLSTQLERLAKVDSELSIFKNTLVETQATLRREVVDAINSAMGAAWGMVYPYGDYRSVRMVADEKGYSFEVFDGNWHISETVSGGERASIAIALRVALATVLAPQMGLIILDEPTHNLDREAVALLARVLQYDLPNLVPQAFVITHDEELIGADFASAYRLSRDKASGAPTRIEEA